jgi:hypothetical protein
MFHSVHCYFKTENSSLTVPHPTILLANHVSEQDIVALSHVYPNIPIKTKFCFAMRQDIIEPDFLTKEFEPKGLIRFILWLIDKSQIVKVLLLYIGGIGVKRAFRDDARKLLKQGELRNLVDSQWDKLADGVLSGRNLFLFPEGKFSESGNLDSIKRGTFLIFKRIPNVSYNYVNFTYDFISEDKPVLHIGHGEISHFPEDSDEHTLATEIKAKLGNNYILTQGNIFSYFLFRDDLKNGISEQDLTQKLVTFMEKVKSGKKYFIAKDLLSEELVSLFKEFLSKAAKSGFIKKNDTGNLQATDKLTLMNFRNGKDMRKKNPYLYHFNQLKYYSEEFDRFYSEV